MRPTARAFLDAATHCGRRRRCGRAPYCRTPPAACSIRSSACVDASRSAPNSSVTLLLWTQLADSRDGALALSARLDNPNAAELLFAGAADRAEAERQRLGIEAAQLARFAHWMSALFTQRSGSTRGTGCIGARSRRRAHAVGRRHLRRSPDRAVAHRRQQRIAACAGTCCCAQNYWRSQQLAVDVVLLNTAGGADGDALHSVLVALVSTQQAQLKSADQRTQGRVVCAARQRDQRRPAQRPAHRRAGSAGRCRGRTRRCTISGNHRRTGGHPREHTGSRSGSAHHQQTGIRQRHRRIHRYAAVPTGSISTTYTARRRHG